MNNLGYNYLDVPDVAAEMEHGRRAHLGGGLFFQNHIEFARQFKADDPARRVVLRNYPDRKLPASVDDWLKTNQPLAEGGLIVQTVNEIGFGQDVIAFHEALLERIKRDRIKMNLGILGLSVGVPGPDEWYKGERLIRLAADLRDQVHFIMHEYYGAAITTGIIGGNPLQFIQPETWPQDTSGITMWHVGRYRFLKKYCANKGLPLPRIIIGEFGADYVGDIGTWLKTLPSDGGQYDSVDGWRDLLTQWRRWWPTWDGATAYMKQAVYAKERIYTDEEIELILLYCRWNDGGWRTYQTNPELDSHMEAYGQMSTSNPNPPPKDEPPVVITNPPAPQTPAPGQEAAWASDLSIEERAMIDMGRLLAKYGDKMPTLCIEEGVYKLLAKLAGMLDAAG